MKRILALLLLILTVTQTQAQHKPLSLAGRWQFQLDSLDQGIVGQWFRQSFRQSISLPGTLDDAGVGQATHTDTTVLAKDIMLHLARKHRYTGPVWYQRTFTVERTLDNAQLMLERVIWKTDCWLDGKQVGSGQSLIAPQGFSLGDLAPGQHTITLRIDNRKQHDISFNDFAHAYTDGTQILWNGVIGRIEIKARPANSIQQIKVEPLLAQKTVRATVAITGARNDGTFLRAHVLLGNRVVATGRKINLTGAASQQLAVALPEVKAWDEFQPQLYQLQLEVRSAGGKLLDQQTESFGFRTLATAGSALLLNGRPLFLRGTLECNIFPLEGHPPMHSAGWVKVFKAAKDYGLNHLRFHSWCPPEAAFRVADSLGVYLQVELPLWSLQVGKDARTLAYLEEEARHIMDSYGNHPSFCFWSMGNELEGNFEWLRQLVAKLKAEDARHLYTTTTFSFQKGHGKAPEPVDDFFITQYTDKGWVRGQGIFNTNPPDFKTDYSKAVVGLPVPLIIHEVGQYSVYPDLTEIPRYTGVLVPANFAAVRHDLRKKGMLPLAAPFLKASGQLAANLYKEEIERALKTRGVGGFQLLDLHDFPGQGTALVGLLNAFWESKGVVTPAEFRRFCGPVVPLLRFDKAVYTSSETFTASAELANYGPQPLDDELTWAVTTADKRRLATGTLGKKHVAIGNGQSLGTIAVPLQPVTRAQELTITLQLTKSGYANHWKIWVYPPPSPAPTQAVFTSSMDSAVALLRRGASVVFNPDSKMIRGIDGRFAPVFWSPVHFPDQPGSMGLLIDKKHPALADFPTSYHSDWQWWDLVTQSKSLVLDELKSQPVPIIRVVDNFFKNRNLGTLVEFRVGTGKLLLCTMDIRQNLTNRPAARQLRASLLEYATTSGFNPQQQLQEAELKAIVKQ
ncbi:glycoside hydrolase family 2 [Hymenobacter sp. BT186]|uniref:beta-galactosidase n=1 Tax=Hymenobacter telluris TaxID=2816474 RepID=A0A939EXV9_9BACT|nr:sugar-binding domain-containing protein [Hymenobacter telluris]MBO0358595.1 glycoside hydrolase family 2 [Hymenobacter telluris]MBW3374621.1 glycoside hydrolase family 2 [Hymenobacter norwichensis]